MKKILLLLVAALSLFSCEKDSVEVPQNHAGRTLLAFFWADTNTWLNDSLRANIKNMMVGLRSMTDSAALVVYWDGKNNDPNWPTPVIVKYESDGRGSINGYSKEKIDEMISDKSALNDLVGIGKVQKTYSSQTSTEKEVMRTVISDMVQCYPSESYGIMFGSHGSGWLPGIFGTRSIGQDGGQNSTNTALIPELAEALRAANPRKFDFVLLDACMMGCAEVYYELKDVTRYCIASVLDVPGAGFPYRYITPYLYEKDIRKYLPAICESYITVYDKGYWGTVTAVDCSRMDDLAAVTRKVITAHKDKLNAVNTSNLQQYGRSSQNFKGYSYDMVQYVKTLCGGEAPSDFTARFEDAVVYTDYTPNGYSLYRIDGNNYCGIGMYIPNSSTSSKYALWNNYFKSSVAWYEAAGWAETESIWGN